MIKNCFALIVIVAALLSLIWFPSVSQKAAAGSAQILSEYLEAQKIYEEAAIVASSEDYNEEKESALNKIALEKFKKVYSLLSDNYYDSIKFFTAFRIGVLEHYFERENVAKKFYEEAINIKQRLPKLADSFLFKPYLYTGVIFAQSHFDSAIYYYKKAEEIQQQYNIKLTESERLYNGLGTLYYETGNYRQAKNYLNEAIANLSKDHPYYKGLYINYQINLASILSKLEEYDEANRIYQKIISYGININEINHSIGVINLNLGAAKKAIEYFRKVNYDNNRITKLYNDYSSAFFYLKEYDSASHYLEKAIAENKKWYSDKKNMVYGTTFKYNGDYHLQHNQVFDALQSYQAAIQHFYPSYSDTSIYSNPTKFSGVFSYINLFHTLVAKANAFDILFQQTKELKWAIEEINAYEAAFYLTDYVERSYDSDEARLFLSKIKYLMHDKPINIGFKLYARTNNLKWLQKAYYFDQKNKASVLAFNQRFSADSVATAPHLEHEKKLKANITRLSLKATRVSDSSELAAINDEVRDLEIKLGKLQSNFETAGKVSDGVPSINSLQKNFLDDATVLLSYHLSPDSISLFLVTRKKFNGFQIKIDAGFHDSLQQIIATLKSHELEDSDDVYSITNSLYKKLIGNYIPGDINRLIIIPDDELNYFPFEILQKEKDHYLVQDFSIQYHYSTALLNKSKSSIKEKKLLAFAPFSHKGYSFSNNYQFVQLPSSLKEVQKRNGEIYTDTSATKKNFLQKVNDYSIIHLATHAVANDGKKNLSYIVFSPFNKKDVDDFLLYEQEIYNLQLQETDLVILSSCETGDGNLIKGEGIFSLSRAFSYAGCPNIVTSLWKADDEATAYITGKVHDYLKKDFTVDEALQKAKLDYLADVKINPRKKHPSYWSHLIFIGDYQYQKNYSILWLLIPVIIFIAGVLIFINKAPKKKGA